MKLRLLTRLIGQVRTKPIGQVETSPILEVTCIKIYKEHSIYFSKLGKIVKKLFKMVVNVEKLLKMVKNGYFSNLSKNGEMLKNVGENI